jgi:hypothetical protein
MCPKNGRKRPFMGGLTDVLAGCVASGAALGRAQVYLPAVYRLTHVMGDWPRVVIMDCESMAREGRSITDHVAQVAGVCAGSGDEGVCERMQLGDVAGDGDRT